MSNISETINDHYGLGGILSQVLNGLQLAGKEVDSLTVDDLAPVDEFHTRGRESTVELANLADINQSHEMLDVGCGLGGSARFVAHQCGCTVTGIDLTREYIDVAEQLTEMVKLADRVQFRQGSALELPFADSSFDVAWTEHAQMNISDKRTFYSEMARVLRPGGRLVFHDIFRGTGEPPIYPTPWAEDESISFLCNESEAHEHIEQSGLTIDHWENKDDESLQFFERVAAQLSGSSPTPLGIHLLMGTNAKVKLQNYLSNLNRERVTVAMGVATK